MDIVPDEWKRKLHFNLEKLKEIITIYVPVSLELHIYAVCYLNMEATIFPARLLTNLDYPSWRIL